MVKISNNRIDLGASFKAHLFNALVFRAKALKIGLGRSDLKKLTYNNMQLCNIYTPHEAACIILAELTH